MAASGRTGKVKDECRVYICEIKCREMRIAQYSTRI